jgi:hypothetical protein
MESRVLEPVHVHIDYPLSVDELNDYTLKHTTWLNSTTLNLLARGVYGLHHLNDLNGVYIHRWILHDDIHSFQCDKEIIHDIVGTMDPDEDIILLFEETNCYMIYRI